MSGFADRLFKPGRVARGNETRTRVVTGVLGGALLLTLFTVGGSIGVTFGTAVLGGLMCWELSNVFFTLSDHREKLIALVGLAWLTTFIGSLFPKSMLECLIASFMGLFMYYLAVAERHPENLRGHFDELVFSTFTLVYVITFITFLPLLRDGPNGVRWLMLFLCIVWAGDTGAYFVGRKWGRQKLYPLISPGKSLEGAGGGLGASLLLSLLFKLIFFRQLGWVGAAITPLVVGVVSQIGDLCESFFKRAYRIKDSSQILPGHGGMLDRFDGVLFSLPVMYFCCRLFGG